MSKHIKASTSCTNKECTKPPIEIIQFEKGNGKVLKRFPTCKAHEGETIRKGENQFGGALYNIIQIRRDQETHQEGDTPTLLNPQTRK